VKQFKKKLEQTQMTRKFARRDTLKLMATGVSAIGILGKPAIGYAADSYPSRPITLINPNPPAGYTDSLGRVIAGPLAKALGQPVTVVNIPGASEMLGHEYFLKQPDDGYSLLVTAASFIPLNILLQHAPFSISDFSMINLPARDYTLMATSSDNDALKSVGDVAAALKKNAGSLSIGVPRASTDYINVILFAQAIGVDPKKLRLVTFESGGNTRSAVIGGVVDCGFAGGEGFLPLADQIRPLLTFADQPEAPFNSPIVAKANLGASFDFVAGSLRGFAVSSSFKSKYPDRYLTVVKAYETVFKDPKVVGLLNTQQLASEWFGPKDSQAVYLKTFKQMKDHANLLKGS
jgi:putative tricarboxylic transport membrane protein